MFVIVCCSSCTDILKLLGTKLFVGLSFHKKQTQLKKKNGHMRVVIALIIIVA